MFYAFIDGPFSPSNCMMVVWWRRTNCRQRIVRNVMTKDPKWPVIGGSVTSALLGLRSWPRLQATRNIAHDRNYRLLCLYILIKLNAISTGTFLFAGGSVASVGANLLVWRCHGAHTFDNKHGRYHNRSSRIMYYYSERKYIYSSKYIVVIH
jgi:hypothetical protein